MPVNLKYTKGDKSVVVLVTFDAPEQVEKEGLEPGVIANHLLADASKMCTEAAELALSSKTNEDLDAEKAEAVAKLEAEYASKAGKRPVVDIK